MAFTVRSSSARYSKISRRRGSATALKASEVVEARGMERNIYLYRNMSSEFSWKNTKSEIVFVAAALTD
jgi:hypothetical protein